MSTYDDTLPPTIQVSENADMVHIPRLFSWREGSLIPSFSPDIPPSKRLPRPRAHPPGRNGVPRAPALARGARRAVPRRARTAGGAHRGGEAVLRAGGRRDLHPEGRRA
jgi:hypothetical protein